MTYDPTEVSIDIDHPIRDRCGFCGEPGHDCVTTAEVRIATPSDLLEQGVHRCCPSCADVVRSRGESNPRGCIICRKPSIVTPRLHAAVFKDVDALMCESCRSDLIRGEAGLFDPPD